MTDPELEFAHNYDINDENHPDQVAAREKWRLDSIKQEMERKDHALWAETPEFKLHRLLHNFAFDITNKIQEMQDLLEVMVSQHPELIAFDKTTMVLQQMRIVNLETRRLQDMSNRVGDTIKRFALKRVKEENGKNQTTDSGQDDNLG